MPFGLSACGGIISERVEQKRPRSHKGARPNIWQHHSALQGSDLDDLLELVCFHVARDWLERLSPEVL